MENDSPHNSRPQTRNDISTLDNVQKLTISGIISRIEIPEDGPDATRINWGKVEGARVKINFDLPHAGIEIAHRTGDGRVEQQSFAIGFVLGTGIPATIQTSSGKHAKLTINQQAVLQSVLAEELLPNLATNVDLRQIRSVLDISVSDRVLEDVRYLMSQPIRFFWPNTSFDETTRFFPDIQQPVAEQPIKAFIGAMGLGVVEPAKTRSNNEQRSNQRLLEALFLQARQRSLSFSEIPLEAELKQHLRTHSETPLQLICKNEVLQELENSLPSLPARVEEQPLRVLVDALQKDGLSLYGFSNLQRAQQTASLQKPLSAPTEPTKSAIQEFLRARLKSMIDQQHYIERSLITDAIERLPKPPVESQSLTQLAAQRARELNAEGLAELPERPANMPDHLWNQVVFDPHTSIHRENTRRDRGLTPLLMEQIEDLHWDCMQSERSLVNKCRIDWQFMRMRPGDRQLFTDMNEFSSSYRLGTREDLLDKTIRMLGAPGKQRTFSQKIEVLESAVQHSSLNYLLFRRIVDLAEAQNTRLRADRTSVAMDKIKLRYSLFKATEELTLLRMCHAKKMEPGWAHKMEPGWAHRLQKIPTQRWLKSAIVSNQGELRSSILLSTADPVPQTWASAPQQGASSNYQSGNNPPQLARQTLDRLHQRPPSHFQGQSSGQNETLRPPSSGFRK
jgi:hypothetical protein